MSAMCLAAKSWQLMLETSKITVTTQDAVIGASETNLAMACLAGMRMQQRCSECEDTVCDNRLRLHKRLL